MLKAAILLLLLAILASLFGGLFFLIRDGGRGNRVLHALYLRVGLATLTLGLIAWGLHSGALVSHATW